MEKWSEHISVMNWHIRFKVQPTTESVDRGIHPDALSLAYYLMHYPEISEINSILDVAGLKTLFFLHCSIKSAFRRVKITDMRSLQRQSPVSPHPLYFPHYQGTFKC